MSVTAIGSWVQVGATLATLTCLSGARGPVAAAPADLTATFRTLEQSLGVRILTGICD